jgi:penicillin-binding protein 1A
MRRIASSGLLALTVLVGACSYETRTLPPALPTPSESSSIYAADGTLITTLQAEQNRENIALDKLPEFLPQAVIAIEDARYYEHNGVDLTAVLRAASTNATEGSVTEGGSTITQQYVKNAFLDDKQTVARKIEEAALALQLERTYSKDLILELYLNTIYFGRGQYGVQAASYEYFGKPVTEITLSQAALLAGMIQSPSTVDPFLRPDAALERRNIVLDRMLELEMIEPERHERGISRPLNLAEEAGTGTAAPDDDDTDRYPAAYFVEEVKQWILNDPRFGETRDDRINLLFGGGLRIHTTIDLELQRQAEAAVARVLPDQATYPAGALTTMDPRTGHVLAMVGGRDYWADTDVVPYARYNLAMGKGRQSGSAFKPIVLAAALESGMPIIRQYSGPGAISIPRDQAPVWHVRGGCGLVTLVEATVRSCNTVYAQLVMDVGGEIAIEMARRLGVQSDLQSNEAAVLGTNDVTTVDMATAFGTFANHGVQVDPVLVTRIVRADGTILYENQYQQEKVLEAPVADLVTWTLEQVVQRGTGTRAQLADRPAAGKTGTTENSWDAWFVGFTPQRVTAVWVGFPEQPIPMEPPTTPITVFGGTWPAEIWHEVMTHANAGLPVEDFRDPPPTVFAGIGSDQEFIDNRHVPTVLGQSIPRATIALVREGYLAQVVWREERGIPHGVVLAQYPEREEIAQVGSTVVIEVGRPPPKEGEEAPPDDGSELVLSTLADYYNLVTGQDEAPPPVVRPEDEAVG